MFSHSEVKKEALWLVVETADCTRVRKQLTKNLETKAFLGLHLWRGNKIVTENSTGL